MIANDFNQRKKDHVEMFILTCRLAILISLQGWKKKVSNQYQYLTASLPSSLLLIVYKYDEDKHELIK